MTKSIAIIILNYNGQSLLEKFLPCVVNFSLEANIYVIDNASSDNSVYFLKENYPNIDCIILDKNYGYAGGYNRGTKNIKEPIWCLLNSDIEVTKNWLQPIEKLFGENKKIAVIQPKILDYKDKDYFEYAGAGGGFIDAFGIPFCRGRIFEKIEKDFGQYNDVKEVFWATGACFFIKREAFLIHQGFDDSFFAHQEEIDLCWRLKNNDYKVYYQGNSIVYHVGGATLHSQSAKKTYLNFRNSLIMLYKNLPTKVMFQRIFIRMVIDGFIGVKFVFNGKFNHAFAIIKAHFSFYSRLLNLKRPKNLFLKDYYSTHSIVWDYFFRNRKTF